ncbi:RecQ family ATP-dependent DNA helicase [Capnocytophaga sp. G2]|uniref:RecQ family ATP-dependent DNA helicase n=1 Tax=Capnocytophaga sp. G2 TaxID=3110695 RepID=UPI002B497CA3|nr:RecQ family ATP-dependent DNA helicase [Capnocytophaga sp. G2]MEB3005480.1 RecQ family ATP-dependent DNA helicase [Capnocytophaga sp. G2]
MHLFALEILKKYWGYEQFRTTQEPIVMSILEGKDILAMLPTGGGKSLCFQVPAMMKEGVCLVISPLISLMEDQVRSLTDRGIPALALTGSIPYYEMERLMNNVQNKVYKFLYMAPERLDNEEVEFQLKASPINYIVIDEAHCISHWGKDFRPAYLKCRKLKDWFPSLPIIALTATATEKVQMDILENLQIPKATVLKSSLIRTNLAYMIYKIDNKWSRLERILLKNKESSIIYVRNRRLSEELAQHLCEEGFSATSFHGGLPSEEKSKRLGMWRLDDVQVMVATNAFGMGIDKPNVRTVIHWDLPNSLEDYFQEAGRAGRDHQKAFAIILYNDSDVRKLLVDTQRSQVSVPFLKELYPKLCSYFQIVLGEGEGTTHIFNLADFAIKTQLDALKIYQGLEVLDRNSVLSLSQAFFRKATVQILLSSREVINYLERNPQEKELLFFLMRKYSGIHEQTISFRVEKIAINLHTTALQIQKKLEKLKNDSVIAYKSENTDAEITFLMPRDDDRTINYISPQIKWYNQHKIDQCNDVLKYIGQDEKCNQRFLLEYFGEQTKENCGICSHCIENKQEKLTKEHIRTISEEILKLIAHHPMSSQEICLISPYHEWEILHVLTLLLNEEKISVLPTNQYITKE